MSTSADLHGMSDAASIAFSRLVACPFPGCDDGDVDGEPCETCGGSGRVMPPPPALPAMPQPARHVRARYAYQPAFCRIGMPVSGIGTLRPEEPTFCVRRWIDERDEMGEVEVWADELTPDEIDAMSAEDRALAIRWRDVSDERDAEPVHNGEPDPRTVAECAAAAAE